MQLSQVWSHAYVDHFLIYIRPIVFSDWLKHQSSKTPLSKHLHLLLPCQFTGIFWVWIQSTVVRWDSWRKPLPGAQLCRLSITVSAALCPGGHPFLQFLPNIWEGSTGEGWAGFPPPIPPASHKAHAKNYSCLIVSTKSWVHKPRGITLPVCFSKLPRAKGGAGIRGTSQIEKPGPKGRSAACHQTDAHPQHQATKHHSPRQNRVEHCKAEVRRLGHVELGKAQLPPNHQLEGDERRRAKH